MVNKKKSWFLQKKKVLIQQRRYIFTWFKRKKKFNEMSQKIQNVVEIKFNYKVEGLICRIF